jgi:F0F1-type ATP synthase membrane subunit b/b'
MDEKQTLNHLLGLEKSAAKIVDDAKTEANGRINEHEAACRAAYESAYADGYESLEADYTKRIAELDASYQKKLNDYKDGLKNSTTDEAAFFALAGKLLFEVSLNAGG